MSYEIKKVVVQLVANGASVESIAQALQVSEFEAESIITEIYYS